MTNELRIGNYVFCDGKPEKVTGVIQFGVYFAFGYCPNNGLIKPIKLTEDWLLNFGFQIIKNENKGINITFVKDFVKIITSIFQDFSYFNGEKYYKIEHVHELQNLYFVLTGTELKLNEKL